MKAMRPLPTSSAAKPVSLAVNTQKSATTTKPVAATANLRAIMKNRSSKSDFDSSSKSEPKATSVDAANRNNTPARTATRITCSIGMYLVIGTYSGAAIIVTSATVTNNAKKTTRSPLAASPPRRVSPSQRHSVPLSPSRQLQPVQTESDRCESRNAKIKNMIVRNSERCEQRQHLRVISGAKQIWKYQGQRVPRRQINVAELRAYDLSIRVGEQFK